MQLLAAAVATSLALSTPAGAQSAAVGPECQGQLASIPGFGGSFVESNSAGERTKLFIHIVGGHELSDDDLAAVRTACELDDDVQISVLASNYEWVDLQRWHAAMKDALSLPGVTLTAVDERRNRLLIGVDGADQAVLRELDQLIVEHSVPGDAVIIENQSGVRPLPVVSQDRKLLLLGVFGAGLLMTAVLFLYRRGGFATRLRRRRQGPAARSNA